MSKKHSKVPKILNVLLVRSLVIFIVISILGGGYTYIRSTENRAQGELKQTMSRLYFTTLSAHVSLSSLQNLDPHAQSYMTLQHDLLQRIDAAANELSVIPTQSDIPMSIRLLNPQLTKHIADGQKLTDDSKRAVKQSEVSINRIKHTYGDFADILSFDPGQYLASIGPDSALGEQTGRFLTFENTVKKIASDSSTAPPPDQLSQVVNDINTIRTISNSIDITLQRDSVTQAEIHARALVQQYPQLRQSSFTVLQSLLTPLHTNIEATYERILKESDAFLENLPF